MPRPDRRIGECVGRSSGHSLTYCPPVLIPYNTDAPIYHFPFVTVGLIVVNAAVLVACAKADDQVVEGWMLQFGQGLHPLQWISNNFMHAGVMHLIGNMFFLWGFGLVVEGKLGWWRFLLL